LITDGGGLHRAIPARIGATYRAYWTDVRLKPVGPIPSPEIRMNTLDCVLRDDSVSFCCPRCGVEEAIDSELPFVAQLRHVSGAHRCAVDIPATRPPLRLVHSSGA
jgi:hypothetical protein